MGDTTTILCAENPEAGPTLAKWHVLIEPGKVDICEYGYLIVCCERMHGGLHTLHEGAVANVRINGHHRDLIALKDKPAGHTDFFHRLPNPPHLPTMWPVSGCATVYAWPVDKRYLEKSGSQVIEIEIEPDISWDIDYVCIVIGHTSYKLREACKQVLYLLLGAMFGAIATAIFG